MIVFMQTKKVLLLYYIILFVYTKKLYIVLHVYKLVCGLLRTGVVAIFDPLDGHISRHVQSICDAMEIPHIETRWDFRWKRNDHSINLYPRPSILAKAYVDIVKAWGWEQFVIVYEDNEGLALYYCILFY